MVETEHLEESETDQHLELASSVDRRSGKINDWVDHALENQKGPEVAPSSSKFATCINTESGSHQHRNVSTAGASPQLSLPNQTLDCDQQCYPYQPAVSFSDGNGIMNAVSTNPEHETQSLPISKKRCTLRKQYIVIFKSSCNSSYQYSGMLLLLCTPSFGFHSTSPRQKR